MSDAPNFFEEDVQFQPVVVWGYMDWGGSVDIYEEMQSAECAMKIAWILASTYGYWDVKWSIQVFTPHSQEHLDMAEKGELILWQPIEIPQDVLEQVWAVRDSVFWIIWIEELNILNMTLEELYTDSDSNTSITTRAINALKSQWISIVVDILEKGWDSVSKIADFWPRAIKELQKLLWEKGLEFHN